MSAKRECRLSRSVDALEKVPSIGRGIAEDIKKQVGTDAAA
jgi:hypothetical protein